MNKVVNDSLFIILEVDIDYVTDKRKVRQSKTKI